MSDGQAAVFDAAPGSMLLETIALYNLDKIEHVFISHADADHIGGLEALLANKSLTVNNVYFNADTTKDTKTWRTLRIVMDDAARRGNVQKHELQTTLNRRITIGNLTVEVLAPTPGLVMGGVGTTDDRGQLIDSNSMSAVIGLEHSGRRRILFAADMDANVLERVLDTKSQLSADVLVFPHHGGLTHGNAKAFTEKLMGLVQPVLTIFSIGRGKHNTPRPEIISSVRHAAPGTHILCTQLSRHCASSLFASQFLHLTDLPSAGREVRSCCGGSVRLQMDNDQTVFRPFDMHSQFIDEEVPQPLCRRACY